MSKLRVELSSPEVKPNTNASMKWTFVISILMTVATFAALYPFKGTFVRDLMMGRNELNMDRLIFQGTTFWMFALSSAQLFLKNRIISREKKALRLDVLPQDLDVMDTPALIELYNKIIANPLTHKSICLSRISHVLGIWINTGDTERTAHIAKHEQEMDIFLSDSSYRANRLFIWAMPLLGFIGTVFGVSAGIGGFAEFLRGQVTADQIKNQVGLITEGLAVAFYCTLLGLLTAGVAAFPSLGAERREENLLDELDSYLDDRLVSLLPSIVQKEMPAEDISAMRNSLENLKIDIPVDGIVAAIEEGFKQFPNPERYEAVFATAIQKASDVIHSKYNEFARDYERRISDFGATLAEEMKQVGLSFQTGTKQVSDQLASQSERVSHVAKNVIDGFAAVHKDMVEALDARDDQRVERWQTMMSEFSKMAQGLASHFEQMASKMNASLSEGFQEVQTSTRALAGELAKVAQVGSRIDELLKSSQAMEVALDSLSTSGEFKETLSTLNSHLETTDGLLKRLSKPRRIVFEESVGSSVS